MATEVEHRKFSLTNLGNNNNKFWNVTLFDNGDVTSVWGRQGDPGQTKTWHGAGKSFMESKIREKTKKGYRENQTIESTDPSTPSVNRVASTKLHDIAVRQISQDPAVASLITFLVQVNAHQIMQATGGKITYDTSSATFKTTQGIVIPAQVDRAAVLLGHFADLLAQGGAWDSAMEYELNEYLSLIPRDFGRRRITPDYIFPNLSAVQRENDLLDGLRASFAGAIKPKTTKKKTSKKKDDEPKVFSVKLHPNADAAEVKRINDMFHKTKKSGHVTRGYGVKQVWDVEIETMAEAFKNDGAKLPNIWELWHGTKASNLLSILKGGLIIPPSSSRHVTGRMYGDGIYGSSISTKALNYATNFWGSGGNTSRTFMFLMHMAMGNYYIAGSGWGSYPKRGHDSTWAKGGQSGVINDEMIVYRTSQVNLTRLVEFHE